MNLIRPRRALSMVRRLGWFAVLSAAVIGDPVAAGAAVQAGTWSAAMGQSGLRRFYSTGGDLGELLNRQVSYRIANRLVDATSDVEGFVMQWDSLVPVEAGLGRPFFVRGLARSARRYESGKVDGRNDRFDLGVLYAPTNRSYIGIGLAYEHTDAELRFVEGATNGDALGPRIDAGIVFVPTVALGVRLEQIGFEGRSRVSVPTPGGTRDIDREFEYRRRYLKTELMARYTRAQMSFLPAGVQVGWMGGLQYLDTRYEPNVDSVGQPVVEPFGDRERLGLWRAGGYLGATFGGANNWNASVEWMLDYEFDTNLNDPIDDRLTKYLRSGLAYILAPGKRIQLDYQRFRSWNGFRARDNFTIIGVIDF